MSEKQVSGAEILQTMYKNMRVIDIPKKTRGDRRPWWIGLCKQVSFELKKAKCVALCTLLQQAISARERALCQLTVCFEFQSRIDGRKGHKSCALQIVFRRKVT